MTERTQGAFWGDGNALYSGIVCTILFANYLSWKKKTTPQKTKGENKVSSVSPKPTELLVDLGFTFGSVGLQPYPLPLQRLASQWSSQMVGLITWHCSQVSLHHKSVSSSRASPLPGPQEAEARGGGLPTISLPEPLTSFTGRGTEWHIEKSLQCTLPRIKC